jgi:hypothetical protein
VFLAKEISNFQHKSVLQAKQAALRVDNAPPSHCAALVEKDILTPQLSAYKLERRTFQTFYNMRRVMRNN